MGKKQVSEEIIKNVEKQLEKREGVKIKDFEKRFKGCKSS